jgi:hypothetical protein
MLAACSGQDTQAAIETGIAQTMQISALETAAAGAGQPQQQPSATPEAATQTPGPPTETPTATLSPTPSIPMVSVSTETNCRSGPGIQYGFLTSILVGEEVEVVAVFPNSEYVVVKRPGSSGQCWLWLRYADRTDFSAYGLPIATQPPTPTPTYTPTPAFTWLGTWKMWVGGVQYTTTISVTGNTLSGTFIAAGDTITLSGTISNGGQNAAGTWTSPADNGTFQWRIKSGNLNQFVGNYNGGAEAWCGSRSGASMPDPCQWP